MLLALTASSRRAVTSLLTEVKQPNSPVALTGVRDPSPTSISSDREGSMAPDLVLRWRAHWT